jgi:hypothetical protein
VQKGTSSNILKDQNYLLISKSMALMRFTSPLPHLSRERFGPYPLASMNPKRKDKSCLQNVKKNGVASLNSQ